MVNIKRFIERVSAMENKSSRDLLIPIQEARLLRDEIAKLLADKLEERINARPETIDIQVSGGKW